MLNAFSADTQALYGEGILQQQSKTWELVGVNLKTFQSCHHYFPSSRRSASSASVSARLTKGKS